MRKIILFISIITCVTLLVLFISVNIVNQNEELYTSAIPPEIELTDGTNSIKGSVKMDSWYYKGKDNKFYPYPNNSAKNDNFQNGNAQNNSVKSDSAKIGNSQSVSAQKDSIQNFNAINGNFRTFENPDSSINLTNDPAVLSYRGDLALKFSPYSDQYSQQYPDQDPDKCPDKFNLQIFHKGNLIFQENDVVSEFHYPVYQPKEDGELLYKITAFWYESESASRGFYGQVTYEFAFYNDVPIEFVVSPTKTFPGEMVTVSVKYANENEKISLKSDLLKSEIPFYKNEHGQIAVLPLSYDLQPSEYVINLEVQKTNDSSSESPDYKDIRLNESDNKESDTRDTKKDEVKNPQGTSDMDSLVTENVNLAGKKEFQKITISVQPKDFPIQYLTISDDVDKSTRNDAAYEEYDKYIGAVRKTDTPVKMWDGVFLKPVEGRITTEFGMRRFVNDAPTSYRHSGIDIAADRGTPVKATNSGKVILARHLILIGNTVLIDHGYGIISWNYHMDSIAVKEGDDLVKGQIIGKVGSTGFSTGPHLHFAISVHDIFTNPWTLFEQEPEGL
ncbi:MAG TPA: M23 family metallopeptidase [Clostridiales bacterium]|nr:M23 family metallopeptidase [Clostridiales bacterium]